MFGKCMAEIWYYPDKAPDRSRQALVRNWPSNQRKEIP